MTSSPGFEEEEEDTSSRPPDEDGDGSAQVGRKAVKSLVWSGLSFGFTRVVVFITTLLLARLLVPEDFGVVAAALAVIAYLEIMLDLGLGAALIYDQEKGVTPRLHTAFTLNIGLCVMIAIAGWFSAPWLAAFFHASHQEAIFRVVFLFLVIRGLGQIHDSILKRDLRFRRRAAVDISRGVVRAAVSIPMALVGFGAWSIVIGFLASELVGTALNWSLVQFRPRLRIDRSSASTLLRFGLSVTMIKVVGEIGTNADYLVVGRMLGPTELGYYNLAFRIPEMILSSAYWVFSSIAFPVYAKTRTAGIAALGATMRRVLRLSLLFGFTVGVGLAIASRDIVAVALGPQWEPTVLPLALICLAMGLQSIGYASGDIFPAVGRPGLLLAIDTPMTVLLVGGFIVASSYGIAAVAAVHLGFAVIYETFRLVLGYRLTKTPLRQAWSSMRPALCTTAGVVAFALPVRLATAAGAGSLAAVVGAGLLGGAVGLLIGGRDAIAEIRIVLGHAIARA